MSKTYRKNIRQGIACGDNRLWYKLRRRWIKHSKRQALRNVIAHYPTSDADDYFVDPLFCKKDTWREPTDGYWLINKATLKRMTNWPEKYLKKFRRILDKGRYNK